MGLSKDGEESHNFSRATQSLESWQSSDHRNSDRGLPLPASTLQPRCGYTCPSCDPSLSGHSLRASSRFLRVLVLVSKSQPCRPGSRDSQHALADLFSLQNEQSPRRQSIHHELACSRRLDERWARDKSSRALLVDQRVGSLNLLLPIVRL